MELSGATSATAVSSSSTPGRPACSSRTTDPCSTPTRWRWLDEQPPGTSSACLVGTSLPFMLPPGLHDSRPSTRCSPWAPWPPCRRRGAEKADSPSTSSTGPPSTTASSRSSTAVMQVARGRARCGPGHGRVPLGRRAQLLRGRGRRREVAVRRTLAHHPGRLLADPQPDAADGPRHDVGLSPRARAADAFVVFAVAGGAVPRAEPARGR